MSNTLVDILSEIWRPVDEAFIAYHQANSHLGADSPRLEDFEEWRLKALHGTHCRHSTKRATEAGFTCTSCDQVVVRTVTRTSSCLD